MFPDVATGFGLKTSAVAVVQPPGGLAIVAIGATAGSARAIAIRNARRDLRTCIRAGVLPQENAAGASAQGTPRPQRASIVRDPGADTAGPRPSLVGEGVALVALLQFR